MTLNLLTIKGLSGLCKVVQKVYAGYTDFVQKNCVSVQVFRCKSLTIKKMDLYTDFIQKVIQKWVFLYKRFWITKSFIHKGLRRKKFIQKSPSPTGGVGLSVQSPTARRVCMASDLKLSGNFGL